MKEPPTRTPQRMQRPAARLITPYPLPLQRRWKMRPQATQPTRPPHSRHRRRRSSSMSWSPRLAKTSIRYTLPAAPRHRRGRRQPAACAGTKDERSPAAPPIRSGQLVEIRPTKCTRTRHAAAREQTRAQARLTTASSCPECRMLSAISWSPDLWSSLRSVRPRPGSPSQNHQQSDAASGSRGVHCPRGTCYEVALKSSGKSRVVLARYGPQPAAVRRASPTGVRCPDRIAWRQRVLRRTPRTRQHPPPSTTSPGQQNSPASRTAAFATTSLTTRPSPGQPQTSAVAA